MSAIKQYRGELGATFAYLQKQRLLIPLVGSTVQAGFPSPADDFIEGRLDLNDLCVSRPSSTFFVRVEGLSMVRAGIYPGDILVVDRAEEVGHHDIVVAVVDNELTVKRYWEKNGEVKLIAESKEFDDITFKEGQELVVWGVVRSKVTQYK